MLQVATTLDVVLIEDVVVKEDVGMGTGVPAVTADEVVEGGGGGRDEDGVVVAVLDCPVVTVATGSVVVVVRVVLATPRMFNQQCLKAKDRIRAYTQRLDMQIQGYSILRLGSQDSSNIQHRYHRARLD